MLMRRSSRRARSDSAWPRAAVGCVASGSVSRNVAPSPGDARGRDVAVVAPRDLARDREADAGALVRRARPCRRWKVPKMRSAYFSSKPMPLSSTAIDAAPARSLRLGARRARAAATPSRWNLSALLSRFCSTWRSCTRSPSTTGSVLDLDRRADLGDARLEVDRRPRARPRRGRSATSSRPRLLTRARSSRSLIRFCMRPAAASMRVDVRAASPRASRRCARCEALAVHADLAQRLLQVVRRDRGELLELGVRAGERVRAPLGELRALGHLRLERLVERAHLGVRRGELGRAHLRAPQRDQAREPDDRRPATTIGPEQPRARAGDARVELRRSAGRARAASRSRRCRPRPRSGRRSSATRGPARCRAAPAARRPACQAGRLRRRDQAAARSRRRRSRARTSPGSGTTSGTASAGGGKPSTSTRRPVGGRERHGPVERRRAARRRRLHAREPRRGPRAPDGRTPGRAARRRAAAGGAPLETASTLAVARQDRRVPEMGRLREAVEGLRVRRDLGRRGAQRGARRREQRRRQLPAHDRAVREALPRRAREAACDESTSCASASTTTTTPRIAPVSDHRPGPRARRASGRPRAAPERCPVLLMRGTPIQSETSRGNLAKLVSSGHIGWRYARLEREWAGRRNADASARRGRPAHRRPPRAARLPWVTGRARWSVEFGGAPEALLEVGVSGCALASIVRMRSGSDATGARMPRPSGSRRAALRRSWSPREPGGVGMTTTLPRSVPMARWSASGASCGSRLVWRVAAPGLFERGRDPFEVLGFQRWRDLDGLSRHA